MFFVDSKLEEVSRSYCRSVDFVFRLSTHRPNVKKVSHTTQWPSGLGNASAGVRT